jgi:hypothetical protein
VATVKRNVTEWAHLNDNKVRGGGGEGSQAQRGGGASPSVL